MSQLFSVKIVPQEWECPASDAESVLSAAERAGIRLPSSCRNGTCRTCLCRMVDGRVRYLIEWPGLSRDEKQDGYILPCVAVAESDLCLEVRGTKSVPRE